MSEKQIPAQPPQKLPVTFYILKDAKTEKMCVEVYEQSSGKQLVDECLDKREGKMVITDVFNKEINF